MDPKRDIPREAETIAVKRAARVAEKIRRAKEGLIARKAWWSDGPFETLALLAFFILNFYLILPLFGTPAVPVPFSGPVIPFLAETISFFLKTPFLYSVQIVNIVFFLTFPFSVYFLVKKITGRKLAAIIAVLVNSVPVFLFAKIRIEMMFFGVDATHIAALSLTPLALYGLLAYLREGKVKNFLIAAVTSAVVALTSPFAFLTFMIFAAIFVFSEILLGEGRLKIFRFLSVAVVAGGLNSFWYNPSFFMWMVTGPLGEDIRETISKLIPISFFTVPVLATFGYLLFDRRPNLQSLFLSMFCTISFLIITLAGKGIVPSGPSRYLPEFGISISFLIGVLAIKALDFLKFRFSGLISNALSGGIVFLLLLWSVLARELLLQKEEKVLGVWSEVEKGEIWLAKDKFTGAHSLFGVLITVATFGGIIFVLKKGEARFMQTSRIPRFSKRG